MSHKQDELLEEQVAYYRARASEYDEWFLRQGRYDKGVEFNQEWRNEVSEVREALDAFQPVGRVLELACGTGLWTDPLLRHAENITAVDVSPEMIVLNQQRVRSDRVRYVQADVFEWRPTAQYDVVFFGFWLSHVPAARFEGFWEVVRRALAPEGRVFFVDSLFEPSSTAKDHHLADAQSTAAIRKLNDGRTFRIVKVFYQPDELAERLAHLGWRFAIRSTARFFLYGAGRLLEQ